MKTSTISVESQSVQQPNKDRRYKAQGSDDRKRQQHKSKAPEKERASAVDCTLIVRSSFLIKKKEVVSNEVLTQHFLFP